jgi:hypothetical protein
MTLDDYSLDMETSIPCDVAIADVVLFHDTSNHCVGTEDGTYHQGNHSHGQLLSIKYL